MDVLSGKGIDPMIFIDSTLFLLSCGLLILRLMSYLVRLIFRIGKNRFSPAVYAAFMQIISSIDREAFVTVHQAREINGEGWTKHDLDTAANEEADRAHKLIVEGALNHGSDNTENQ